MKSICVPTSSDAMSRLDTDSCIDGDLVEISLDQSDFDELQKSGLIGELNSTLGLLIDEFEDESISNSKLDSAISIYKKYTNKLNLDENKVAKIQDVLELAKTKNTGVFFFL